MFFSAYLGGGPGFTPWRQAVAWHAHRLGLVSRVERRTLPDSGLLGLAWLESESRRSERHWFETDRSLHARTLGAATPDDGAESPGAVWNTLASAPDGNAIRVTASLERAELTVIVPPTTPEQLYYARTPDGWVFADDLRIFPQLTDTELDECAVYALLQYGAIPPALTIYRSVRRVPNGHIVHVRRDPAAVRCTPFFRPADVPRHAGGVEDAERSIGNALDAVLARVPADGVLYFSGGVDSGLMAARLARLGRHDVRLVTYAFDAPDEEHLLAMRMAAHLGFTCDVVGHEPAYAAEVLERAGRDYSFPFGDISTIPTNALVHRSLRWASQSGTVVEGTGADGTYGLGAAYPKWRRTYAVPHLVRRQIANLYDWLDLWRFDTRVERAGRLVRKTTGLPMPYAVIAQNAFQGIAYDTPPQVQAGLAHDVREYLDAITGGATVADRLSLLDVVWVCAGRMAPKSFDPLRTRGIHAIYPFLEPSLLSVGTSLSWETKCAGGQAKAVLKRMLARDVPAEWVYRRKRGFTRSADATFASAPVQEFLHEVVLSPSNPLSDFCRIDVVRRIVDRARHHSLSVGAHYFLWGFAFAAAWLRPQPGARALPGWIPDPERHGAPHEDAPVAGGGSLDAHGAGTNR